MRRLVPLTLVMVIFVVGACGSGGGRSTKVVPKSKNPSVGASAEIVLKSRNPVVALAIQASDIAWLEEGDLESATPFSLWLQASGKKERLPLQSSSDGFCDNFEQAKIELDHGVVGWYVHTRCGNTGSIDIGASSAQPPMAAVPESEGTDEDAGPGVGQHITGVAAANGSVYWATTSIDYDVNPPPEEDFCDQDPTLATSCETWISGGSISKWKDGNAIKVDGFPPAAALAGDGRQIAIATWPRGPRGHGDYPPLGEVVVLGPGEQIVARVQLPKAARRDWINVELALSQRLLAVSCSGGVWIWELPSGRLVRRLNLGPASIALTRNRLVIWGSNFVATVDPASGRQTQIATTPVAPDASEEGITAVASDGDRLAWARTDSRGHSVVKMIAVD